jgi:hypothetical protein
VRNSLDRDRFLKSFGEKKFNYLVEHDSHYKKYREPPIPLGCRWIWNQFYFLWMECPRDFNGNVILGFQEINEYEKCMKIHFSLVEKKLIINMKHWVQETINELND